MKKSLLLCILILSFTACDIKVNPPNDSINMLLDSWHHAAAKADGKTYFDLMDDSCVFIGTDSTERWTKQAFQEFAMPHFDKGKGWDFTPVERHISFSEDGKIAWFDEKLHTWMGVCFGSGVVISTEKGWKIKHYLLAMTIPNDKVRNVIQVIEGDTVE